MINLYIAPCGWGKTQELNNIFESRKDSNLVLFFPSGSEIQSVIKGNENKSNGNVYENNLSIILKKYIENKIDPSDKKLFLDLKQKRDEIQNEVLNDWKNFDKKSQNPLSNFIKGYDFGDETELPKVTLNTKEKFSVGEIWFNHILLCITLLEHQPNNFRDFTIIFDEPESYMHPDWIINLANKIAKMNNSNNNLNFHIASHSPIFISALLNQQNNNITIYLKKDKNENWKPIVWTPQYCSSNKILFEIYNVSNIEFLDELISELMDPNGCNLNFTTANDSLHSNNTDVLKFPNNAKYENQQDKWFWHNCYISFARNYYHHPEDRKGYDKFILDNQLESIESILVESIKNAIDLLKKNGKYKEIIQN